MLLLCTVQMGPTPAHGAPCLQTSWLLTWFGPGETWMRHGGGSAGRGSWHAAAPLSPLYGQAAQQWLVRHSSTCGAVLMAPLPLCQAFPCLYRCYFSCEFHPDCMLQPSQLVLSLGNTTIATDGLQVPSATLSLRSSVICPVISLYYYPFLLSQIESDKLTKLLDLGNKWQPMALCYKSPVMARTWVSMSPVGQNSLFDQTRNSLDKE